jgi:hypothetical protein
MLTISGRNDLLCSYFVTQRDEVDYNPSYIGSYFSASKPASSTSPSWGLSMPTASVRCLTAKPVTTTSMFFPDDAVYRPTRLNGHFLDLNVLFANLRGFSFVSYNHAGVESS